MAIAAQSLVTLESLQDDPWVLAYIEHGNEYLGRIGYTEHGLRHANLVAHIAGNVLRRLGYSERLAELASMAGFMHDMGNTVGREVHGVSAALLAQGRLEALGMDPHEAVLIMNALGNHEEEFGRPASEIAAALILADKSDVHHTRVRAKPEDFDIHDRVNFAAKRSFLRVEPETRTITLEIEIDTSGTTQVMEYFEIFLSRMQMARTAAEVLDAHFSLVINGSRLL
jgi:metal-dependent HD superfamily phosphatase/phosphodiesterase